MKYTVHCKNNEEAAFLDYIIKSGLLNVRKDWLKENFPNLDYDKFNITYKMKDKSKRKCKNNQLPGQTDMFDVIDNQTE